MQGNDALTDSGCSLQRRLDETISRDFLDAADFAASLDEYRCVDDFSVRWDFEVFSVDSRSVSVYLCLRRVLTALFAGDFVTAALNAIKSLQPASSCFYICRSVPEIRDMLEQLETWESMLEAMRTSHTAGALNRHCHCCWALHTWSS